MKKVRSDQLVIENHILFIMRNVKMQTVKMQTMLMHTMYK